MIHRFCCGLTSLLTIFLFSSGTPLFGASLQTGLTDSIRHHAHQLIRNQNLEVREMAFDFLNRNLGTFMDSFSPATDSFPRLEGLAVLENKAERVRVVTYQLYRDTSDYRYGGWVQSPRLNAPVFLTDNSEPMEMDPDLDFLEMDPDNWYGALYYEMKTMVSKPGEQIILLFGLDNYRFFTKRKLIEAMIIREDEVRFGLSMVAMEDDLPREYWKKRFILDYSVQSPPSLRFDEELDMIIFDHLIFMPSNIPQQRIMRVPDGTYSGFEIDPSHQKLVFVDKVFNETMEEAPDGRESAGTKRDLFGNPIDDR